MKAYPGQKAKPLPEEIAGEYYALQKQGGEFRASGNMAKAEEYLMRAWHLLPEPKSGWSESLSKATGLAVFFLNTGQFQKAVDWVPNIVAVNPEGYFGYVDVLVGRIYLEAGKKEEAIKWFQRAYDNEGKSAFRETNRQYLEYIQPKKVARKPASPKAEAWPEIPDPKAFKLIAGPLSLDQDVHNQIKTLCAEGDALAEVDNYDEAIAKYREALSLVPRPIEKWEAATWIYIAIGDALFLKGDFQAAAKPLRDVMFCPGAEKNGFIRLRRGQVAFEKGNLPVAEKELIQAFQLEGEEIFAADDVKYLDFVKAKLKDAI